MNESETIKKQMLSNLEAIAKALQNGCDILIKTTPQGLKVQALQYTKLNDQTGSKNASGQK